MKIAMQRRFVLAVMSALLAGGAALAAEPAPPAPADPTPEQRHKMAEIHQRMADCLVSERPISDCRAEMQKSCQGTTGKEGCMMMGGGGMGAGMMGGGMMHEPVEPTAPSAPEPGAPSGSPDPHGH